LHFTTTLTATEPWQPVEWRGAYPAASLPIAAPIGTMALVQSIHAEGPNVTISDASVSKAVSPARRIDIRRLLPLVLVALGVASYAGYRAWSTRQPFEWSGTVEARTMAVGSRTGGRVKEVLLKEGDRAQAGQALLVLEPGDLEAQKLMAQAQLDQAQAALDKLTAGARPEEIEEAKARAQTAEAALVEAEHGSRAEEIAGARARLAAAQVTLDKAQLDEDRSRKLFAAAAIPQAEVDTAEAVLRGAVAQRDALAQALDELIHGVRKEEISQAATRAVEARANAKLVVAGSRVEDLRAGRAQVDAARGRLDQVLVMLDELVVRAPRAARVETLDLRPGDILGPNATAAVLLEDAQLYVRIYIPETQIGHARIGAEVPVYVDSFPDRPFAGVIEHIDSEGEYSPRNLQTADERANQVFATRVGLSNGVETLRAGMAAFIRVAR
jgi:multidrug resistance efflux pump